MVLRRGMFQAVMGPAALARRINLPKKPRRNRAATDRAEAKRTTTVRMIS